MGRPFEKDLPPAPWLSVRPTPSAAKMGTMAVHGASTRRSGGEPGESASTSSLAAMLFAHAQIFVEGGLDTSPLVDNDYVFASVMLTIDMCDLPLPPGERADAISAQRWAVTMLRDCEVRACLSKIAKQKIEEILGRHLGDARMDLDVRARAESTRILVDADAMVSLFGFAGGEGQHAVGFSRERRS